MKHRKSRDYNGINNLPTAAGFHPSTVAMENEPFSSMIYLFNCLVSIDAKHRLNHSHVRTPGNSLKMGEHALPGGCGFKLGHK